MSQDAAPSIEESQPPVRREGPGATLRSAREAAGLSREEVARSLNLDKWVVEALESDSAERLPEPAYVKGYLRAYARLLELNADQLLEAYAGLAVPQPEVLPRESASAGVEQRVRTQVAGGVIILILIAVSAWWLTRPKPSSAPPPQSQATATQTQQSQPTNAVGASSSSQSSPQVIEPSVSGAAATVQKSAPETTAASVGAPTASPATPGASAASTPTPKPKPAAQAPAASNPSSSTSTATSTAQVPASTPGTRIVLQLSAKSWVQINDSAGRQLFRGLLDAGAQRTFSGTPPFAVFLGYAPGVVLRIDGKQVSAAQYTQSNNTARFTLLADGQTHR